jgi:hypothetical protein
MRPSAVVNWARNNLKRLDATRDKLRSFALRPPRHSLTPVYHLCTQHLYGNLTLKQALDAIDEIKHPIARMAAREILPCFASYINTEKLEGVPELDSFELPYPIGRSPDGMALFIRIKPTFVAVHGIQLVPYFVIGWSAPVLSGYQKQLLSTLICKSLLSHQNFIGSDAQIVCILRIKGTKTREIRQWNARLYDDLSENDVRDQVDRYGKALHLVVRELRGE